jgi:hypothetical protein
MRENSFENIRIRNKFIDKAKVMRHTQVISEQDHHTTYRRCNNYCTLRRRIIQAGWVSICKIADDDSSSDCSDWWLMTVLESRSNEGRESRVERGSRSWSWRFKLPLSQKVTHKAWKGVSGHPAPLWWPGYVLSHGGSRSSHSSCHWSWNSQGNK